MWAMFSIPSTPRVNDGSEKSGFAPNFSLVPLVGEHRGSEHHEDSHQNPADQDRVPRLRSGIETHHDQDDPDHLYGDVLLFRRQWHDREIVHF